MLTNEPNNWRIINNPNFSIEISIRSGFCFGVLNAINKAEKALQQTNKIYSVGSIVHNKQEVARLSKLGLEVIAPEQIDEYNNKNLLFRAHGEPPESYAAVNNNNNTLIDATCPVVLKLQQRIKKSWETARTNDTQIVIFGKKNHPEVLGLLGQTENKAVLISNLNDFTEIDFTKPIELFAQTTMPLKDYAELYNLIKSKASEKVIYHQTICRQVADREVQLNEFAQTVDVILFVGDDASSNSKVLFHACKKANAKSYFVTTPADIEADWLKELKKVGVCGATSTPLWLMQQVAKQAEKIKLTNAL